MPREDTLWRYTLEHFREIARQNRFPENASIPHDSNQCLICHPEKVTEPPFKIYLRVVAEAIKVRRPSIDQDLIDTINNDLALMGEPIKITQEAILKGEEHAVQAWRNWVREAIETALEMLSVHSDTSHELSLEDGERLGFEAEIEGVIDEIMNYQRTHT